MFKCYLQPCDIWKLPTPLLLDPGRAIHCTWTEGDDPSDLNYLSFLPDLFIQTSTSPHRFQSAFWFSGNIKYSKNFVANVPKVSIKLFWAWFPLHYGLSSTPSLLGWYLCHSIQVKGTWYEQSILQINCPFYFSCFFLSHTNNLKLAKTSWK